MNIYPACSIKTLVECEPTQLVRVVEYGRLSGMFCLVTQLMDSSDLRALIVLGDEQPAFHIVKSPEAFRILASDEKPTFAFDVIGPFEAAAQYMYNAIGCVTRGDRRLMRVREYHTDFRAKQASYDLESGMLIDLKEELNGVAFFGKWSITMPAANKLSSPTEVASFAWKEPQPR